jgi:hypothetical protein
MEATQHLVDMDVENRSYWSGNPQNAIDRFIGIKGFEKNGIMYDSILYCCKMSLLKKRLC